MGNKKGRKYGIVLLITVLFTALTFIGCASGTPPEVAWSRTFGGSSNDLGDSEYPIAGGGNFDYHPLCQTEASVKGDLNSDDQITPADAAIALAIAATGAHDDAADVSGDGQVTSLDALMILQAAADRIEL